MHCVGFFVVTIVLLLLAGFINGERVKRGLCSTRFLDIDNGSYQLRSSNAMVIYSCNRGYTLYGAPSLQCISTEWSSKKPMCITNTCDPVAPSANMQIHEEENGAVLKFECDVQYKLSGPYKLTCGGQNWSGYPPVCQSWTPPTECDFENSALCGWSHHDNTDVDWRWHTGSTRTKRTGPEYDHTLGKTGAGHYLYFESSSPTAPDHKAILMSPKYLAEQGQQACFSFWYHILGTGDIGDLEVFFKPVSADIDNIRSSFKIHTNMGETWQFHSVDVKTSTEPFQIVIIATRATSYRSDFALDDVKLFSCPPATTTTISTTPKPTTTTTTTSTTTTTTPTTTTPTTTTHTTTNPTTTTTSTTPPITTPKPTTTAVKTTMAPKVSTTLQPVTTKATTLNSQTSKSTLPPIINPHQPGVTKSQVASADNSSNKVWYILLGIGLVLGITAAVVVGIVFYRRRKNNYVLASFHADNPVYTAYHEDQVHIVTDDGYDQI